MKLTYHLGGRCKGGGRSQQRSKDDVSEHHGQHFFTAKWWRFCRLGFDWILRYGLRGADLWTSTRVECVCVVTAISHISRWNKHVVRPPSCMPVRTFVPGYQYQVPGTRRGAMHTILTGIWYSSCWGAKTRSSECLGMHTSSQRPHRWVPGMPCTGDNSRIVHDTCYLVLETRDCW